MLDFEQQALHAQLLQLGFAIDPEQCQCSEYLAQDDIDQLLAAAAGETFDLDDPRNPERREQSHQAYAIACSDPGACASYIAKYPERTADLLSLCAHDACAGKPYALLFICAASNANLLSPRKWKELYIRIAEAASDSFFASAFENQQMQYGPGWRDPEAGEPPRALGLINQIKPLGFDPQSAVFTPTSLADDPFSYHRNHAGLPFSQAAERIIDSGRRTNLFDQDAYGFCAQAIDALEDEGFDAFESLLAQHPDDPSWKLPIHSTPQIFYAMHRLLRPDHAGNAPGYAKALSHLATTGTIGEKDYLEQIFRNFTHARDSADGFNLFAAFLPLKSAAARAQALRRLSAIAENHPDDAIGGRAAICSLLFDSGAKGLSARAVSRAAQIPENDFPFWNALAQPENFSELSKILPGLAKLMPEQIPELIALQDQACSQNGGEPALPGPCASLLLAHAAHVQASILSLCLRQPDSPGCSKLAHALLAGAPAPAQFFIDACLLLPSRSAEGLEKFIPLALNDPGLSMSAGDAAMILMRLPAGTESHDAEQLIAEHIRPENIDAAMLRNALNNEPAHPRFARAIVNAARANTFTPDILILAASSCSDEAALAVLRKTQSADSGLPAGAVQEASRQCAKRGLNLALQEFLSFCSPHADADGNTLSHYAIAGDNWTGALLADGRWPGDLLRKNDTGVSAVDCAVAKGGDAADRAKAWAKTRQQALDMLGQAEGAEAADQLLADSPWVLGWAQENKFQFEANRALAGALGIARQAFEKSKSHAWDPKAKTLTEIGLAQLMSGKTEAGCLSLIEAGNIAHAECAKLTAGARSASQTSYGQNGEMHSKAAEDLRSRRFSNEAYDCAYVCSCAAKQLLAVARARPAVPHDSDIQGFFERALRRAGALPAQVQMRPIDLSEDDDTRLDLAQAYAEMGDLDGANELFAEIQNIPKSACAQAEKIFKQLAGNALSTEASLAAKASLRRILAPAIENLTETQAQGIELLADFEDAMNELALSFGPLEQAAADKAGRCIDTLAQIAGDEDCATALRCALERRKLAEQLASPDSPKDKPAKGANISLTAQISILCATASKAAYHDETAAWLDLVQSGRAIPLNGSDAAPGPGALDLPSAGTARNTPYAFENGLWQCGLGRALAFETTIEGQKTYVLAVRGTQANQGMGNLEFLPKLAQEYLPIWRHAELIKPLALAIEQKALREGAKFIITGHSLGGSCAETLCQELPGSTCAVTFGSPGTGLWHPAFGWRFRAFGPEAPRNPKTLSFYHPLDPVPKIGALPYVKTARHSIATGSGNYRKKLSRFAAYARAKAKAHTVAADSETLRTHPAMAAIGFNFTAHKSSIYETLIHNAEDFLRTQKTAAELNQTLLRAKPSA